MKDCVANPNELMVNCVSLAATVILKLPALSVTTVFLVTSASTEAPGIATPEFEVTFPSIVLVWENAVAENSIVSAVRATIIFLVAFILINF